MGSGTSRRVDILKHRANLMMCSDMVAVSTLSDDEELLFSLRVETGDSDMGLARSPVE